MQNEANVHTVKIQQTYWVKDTSEEKMLAMGAVRLGTVVEQVDYYDTDLYDLAVKEMWLSKMGQEWQLIVGKNQNNDQDPPKKKVEKSNQGTQRGNSTDNKTQNSKTSDSKTSKNHKEDPKTGQNGNVETVDTDGKSRKLLTCHSLADKKEIMAYLCQVLHITGKMDNTEMEDFLQKTGIQKYASVSNVTRETFRMRNDYTVLLKTEGTTSKKTAVVSLDVDIEKVAQGFERLEQLANELGLQLQNI